MVQNSGYPVGQAQQPYYDPNMMNNNPGMWNPGYQGNDPNAWGQQAALWTQQQQQQQQMWNQAMWNPHMGGPYMQPQMDPNMNPGMQPPVQQYGMQQQQPPPPHWGQMNMGPPPQNWNCGPMGPPNHHYQGHPQQQQQHHNPPNERGGGNWGNYSGGHQAVPSLPPAEKNPPPAVVDSKPTETPEEKEKEKKEKEKPIYKKTNIVLPDIPEDLQPQVEALQIYGVVPANRKKSQYVSNTGMGFYCEVCQCYISSLTNAETHVRGVRHKQNKKFKDGAESVFVVATKKRYVHLDSAEETDLSGKPLRASPMPKKRKKEGEEGGEEGEETEDNSIAAEGASGEETIDQAPSADEIYYETVNADATIQAMLDALEEPIIGLSEIVEHQIPDNSLPAYYICKPCDVRLNANNLMFHIKGLRHRVTYMATLKPNEVKELEQKRHHEQVTEINKMTETLQAEVGKGKLQVVMDNDTSHHPYSIRLAIKAREGHKPKNNAVPTNKALQLEAAKSEALKALNASSTKEDDKNQPLSASTATSVPGGTVVGTKIVVKPDGTRVRVKTVLRPKNPKLEESGDGTKPKTVVKRKVPEGAEIKVTKTTDASGKVVVKKTIVKRVPSTSFPEALLIPGMNDQPLVFGSANIEVSMSRMETATQTDEPNTSFILDKLKSFKVDTNEDAKQALVIIDALSDAMLQYKLRNLPPTVKDAVLESVSSGTIQTSEVDIKKEPEEKTEEALQKIETSEGTENKEETNEAGNEVKTEVSENEGAPEVSENEVAPEVSENECAPEVSENECAPEVSENEGAPEVSENEGAPEVSENEVAPETEQSEENEPGTIEVSAKVNEESEVLNEGDDDTTGYENVGEEAALEEPEETGNEETLQDEEECSEEKEMGVEEEMPTDSNELENKEED